MDKLKKTEGKFSMIFKDIYYEVKLSSKLNTKNKPVKHTYKQPKYFKKIIINNVSGYANSGEITAIMGPSGSGKTSLLNFINNRIKFTKNSKHEGKVFINSEQIDFNKISNYSGYVMQDDVLFPILTPFESLRLATQLRNLVTNDEVDNFVNALLEDLQLTGCKNTKIGNAADKGISGGERKRTSIGVELISNPSILFLDEPTSGLDSQTSQKIISLLKKIAKEKNLLVICTIHQPSSNIFNLFDKLLILEEGSLVYNDSPENITKYFNKINKPLPKLSNPADGFMRILEEHRYKIKNNLNSVDNNNNDNNNNNNDNLNSENNQLEVVDNNGIYNNNDLKDVKINKDNNNKYKEDNNDISEIDPDYFMLMYNKLQSKKINEDIDNIIENNSLNGNLKSKSQDCAPFCKATYLLSYRSWLNLVREPAFLVLKTALTLIFSFLIASVFWQLKPDTYDGIYGRVGFFFFFSINSFMSQIFTTILTFPVERELFIREYSSKMYTIGPYFLSKNIIETPPIIIFSTIIIVISYFTVGLRTDDGIHFFYFWMAYILISLCAQSIGYMLGTLFSSISSAMASINILIMPFILFAGTLINEDSMPIFLFWFKYISPLKYTIEISNINEFKQNPEIMYPGGGDALIEANNYDVGFNNCFIILSCMIIGFRILAFIFLNIMIKKVG